MSRLYSPKSGLLLNHNQTIRKIISSLLLLIFVICMAPKSYFHDALAQHKDRVTVCTHPVTSAPCLHQAAIDCHFDLLVITSLYVFTAEMPVHCLQHGNPPLICAATYHYSILRCDSKESRGPPANL